MEQAVEIAKFLEANGVDAIDISAGGLRSNAEDAFQDTAYPVIRVGDAIRADKIHAAPTAPPEASDFAGSFAPIRRFRVLKYTKYSCGSEPCLEPKSLGEEEFIVTTPFPAAHSQNRPSHYKQPLF